MAKREPLFEADLGDNGGLLRFWSPEEVAAFIKREQDFWRDINEGAMGQPFGAVSHRLGQLSQGLNRSIADSDAEAGASCLRDVFGDPKTRIPMSTSLAGQGLLHVKSSMGLESARGALAAAIPVGVWGDGLSHESRPFWRGMMEQVVFENGMTPQAVEAAKRALNGLNGRASQVLAGIENVAHEQFKETAIDFEEHLERQKSRAEVLERKWIEALGTFAEDASRTSANLESTHKAYIEQMKLKAPVKYWSDKAAGHKRAAGELRNWVAGFFALMIGGYVLAFAALHQQFAAFLLQFQGSTGALLVVSAVFALLASLPLWIGRLLVKFYLSEHHLATDAKERETMTQTYLALTADGVVDEKDRALILGALFRSTPDGVVKDNAQPDTSPAAMLSKLLDSR